MRRRSHWPAGIPLPVLRQVERVPRRGVLYIRRQVRRLVARVPGRGLLELGRLSELERAGLEGDALHLGPAGRYVNGSARAWGMWRGGEFMEEWWGDGTTPADLGTYSWNSTALGAGSTLTKPPAAALPVGWGEAGVLRITSAGASGDGGIVGLNPAGAAPLTGDVPVGTWCAVKVRLSGAVTNLTAWTGIANGMSAAHVPDAALSNTVNVIGFVARAGGAGVNWSGICRTGTSETLLDLGVAADADWRLLAWQRTAAGIRFWAGPGSPVGTITTNIPAVKAIPVVGLLASTAAARALDQDMIGLRWPGRRI